MKVILSRKGFDSTNGGIPSPIMPDGTLLSMPIPSHDDIHYDGLSYNGTTYSDILHQLAPNKTLDRCHLDPDIREDCRIHKMSNWEPAFGQINSAQGVLKNANVEAGDIFLFFGWFRQTEIHNEKLRFVPGSKGGFYDHADLHIIYGYMQIGDIITKKEEIAKYPWHPHSMCGRLENDSNAIYTPARKLSILPDRNGYGVLDYREDRILTMQGKNRATWNALPFLMPEHVYGQRRNSAGGEGLYYGGIWQELVVYESDGLMDWVKSILI